ncbi:MAG: YihY/virulence factor BrkB family protein [Bifidobacteriaceae bacterium]|jgi:membrane protein|nr:YihY/virulence factor BrkB family protein [Bifidobacteriaceae bacterium]
MPAKGRLKARLERLTARPWVRHVRRAQARYRDRLGPESAAAMAFYSLLTVIPTLVFAMTAVAFALGNYRPDLIEDFQVWFANRLGDEDLSARILKEVAGVVEVTDGSREHLWTAVKLMVGTAVLMAWGGGNWLRHIRRSLNMIWRPHADEVEYPGFIVWRLIKYIFQFGAFVILLFITLATSTLATHLTTAIMDLVGYQHGLIEPFLSRLVFGASSVLFGWMLFIYVLGILPSYRQPFRTIAKGALMGAVIWFAVQQAMTYLIHFLYTGQTASFFGPLFVALVVFNFLGQVVLWVAAWTATLTDNPAVKKGATRVVRPATVTAATVPDAAPQVGLPAAADAVQPLTSPS